MTASSSGGTVGLICEHTMVIIKRSLWIGLGLSMSLVSPGTAPRGHDREDDRPRQLVITSAVADLASERILIRGRNFGEEPPRVTLAETELSALSFTPAEILATLPAGLEPGTYLLTSRGIIATARSICWSCRRSGRVRAGAQAPAVPCPGEGTWSSP